MGRRQLLTDAFRLELGVALWRLGDAVCSRSRHRLRLSCWQQFQFEAGCAIAGVGELVIGRRLLDRADRIRWRDDYYSDYQRRPW